MKLLDLVRSNAPLLNELFGLGGYRIDPADEAVKVRASWMELLLTYDPRNQWVSSLIKPLSIPSEMSEEHTSDSLLRFLGIDVGTRRKGDLGERQVADELNLIRPLAVLLQEESKARDAVTFVNGYNAAYTDHFAGKR